MTDTAAYMDSEWIAPNPGTDCALMAAMMYELEVTGKADHAFLAKYCSGWEEDFDLFRPESMPRLPGSGWVQPYTDTPLDHEKVGRRCT